MNGMYQQHQQHSNGDDHHDQGQPSGDNAQSKTLWIGDVEPWMNEQHIAAQFNQIATVTNVKLIRDKARTPVGYGFVEFPDW
jgi:RNA recognition motif-containing protein